MGVKITNNASGTLAAAITSGATTLTLTSGQGALFPTLGVGDYCWCTLVDTSNNVEIIKVTARSTDTLTMTRGQDNTTAQAFAISDRLELRPTAALFAEFADPAMGGDLTGTASNAQIAANAVGLAEMAGGTDGNLITYDASGDPAYVTTGTSGQVLTSGGVGVAPTFQTAASVTFEPMCRAYLGSSLSAIDDTVQIMPFNQTEYNLGSAWDTTNYKFTVPSGEAGYYLINAQLYIGNSSYGIRSGSLYINKSGSDIVYGSIGQDLDTNKTRSDTMSATTIRYLSVGNYIQIKGVCDFNSGSTTSNWVESSTEVSIFKLRS